MNADTVKHLVSMILLSLVILLFAHQTTRFLAEMNYFHHIVATKLASIFSHGSIGTLIRRIISLIVLPVALAGFPALGYWLIKRQPMPYFIHTVWISWIVLMTTALLQN